jgi:hypothetical protein
VNNWNFYNRLNLTFFVKNIILFRRCCTLKIEKNPVLELSHWIKLLDKAIFGERSLEVRVIESSLKEGTIKKMVEQGISCGLIYLEEPRFYWISSENLEKTIALELKRRRCPSAGKEWEELPPFTEETLIVGIAAHEIRHRVQKEFQIEIIKPEDAENTSDPELRALIRFLAKVFEKYPPDLPSPKLEEEFDATVIEWIVAKLWHEGKRDILKLVKIIKEDGKKLKERGVFPSFIYWYSYFRRFFLFSLTALYPATLSKNDQPWYSQALSYGSSLSSQPLEYGSQSSQPFECSCNVSSAVIPFLPFCILPALSIRLFMPCWWLPTGGAKKLAYSMPNTSLFFCLCVLLIVAIPLPICFFILISHSSYHHHDKGIWVFPKAFLGVLKSFS